MCDVSVSVSIRAAGSRRFVPTLAGMAVFVFEGDASGAGAMPVPPAYDVVYAAPVQVPPPAYVLQNAGAYSFAQPAQATFQQAPPRTRCFARSQVFSQIVLSPLLGYQLQSQDLHF